MSESEQDEHRPTDKTHRPLIVITGASSGIGRATAMEFARAGCSLLLVARRGDRLSSLQLDNALCRSVDVLDIDAFAAAVVDAEKLFGPVDCLVNCAGVMTIGPLSEQTPDEWRTMFDVNVIGLLNGIHVVLKRLKRYGKGTIVNVGSVAGRDVWPDYTVYGATKHAVHAISKGLSLELKDTAIRVITVAPGLVATELYDNVPEDMANRAAGSRDHVNGGALAPGDVARVIVLAYRQPETVTVREFVVEPTRLTDNWNSNS